MNKLNGAFLTIMVASSLMLFTDAQGAAAGSVNTPNEIAHGGGGGGHGGGHGGGGGYHGGGGGHGGNWGGHGGHNWNGGHHGDWNRNYYGGYGVGFGPVIYGGGYGDPYYNDGYYDDGVYYGNPQGDVYIDLGN